MRFLGIALRNLASRPVRSGLTALGVAVAVASFIALVGTARGFEAAWVHSLSERGTHMVVSRRGTVAFLAASIDESVAGELRQIDGVEAVAGELGDLAVVDPGHTVLAVGWSRADYLWRTLPLSAGRMPGPEEPNGIVLAEAMAEALDRKVGDTLRINQEDFVITGISKYAHAINRRLLMMQLPTMQRLMERPGKVTLFSLRLSYPGEPERIAELKARLARQFPKLKFTETNEIGDKNRVLRLLRSAAWCISAIALFMGMVMILNTLLMSVAERAYDIGVLSAVGWQAGRVLSMILIEGVLLTAVGSAVGAFLGVGGLRFLAGLPGVTGFLVPEVTARLVFEVLGAALVIGIVGSLYPAWRAVRLNPVDALRHE